MPARWRPTAARKQAATRRGCFGNLAGRWVGLPGGLQQITTRRQAFPRCCRAQTEEQSIPIASLITGILSAHILDFYKRWVYERCTTSAFAHVSRDMGTLPYATCTRTAD